MPHHSPSSLEEDGIRYGRRRAAAEALINANFPPSKSQPAFCLYLFGYGRIDVWVDQDFHRVDDFCVFVATVFRPFLRQVSLLNQVSEQFRVLTVGHAQDVVKALRGETVLISKWIFFKLGSDASRLYA